MVAKRLDPPRTDRPTQPKYRWTKQSNTPDDRALLRLGVLRSIRGIAAREGEHDMIEKLAQTALPEYNE